MTIWLTAEWGHMQWQDTHRGGGGVIMREPGGAAEGQGSRWKRQHQYDSRWSGNRRRAWPLGGKAWLEKKSCFLRRQDQTRQRHNVSPGSAPPWRRNGPSDLMPCSLWFMARPRLQKGRGAVIWECTGSSLSPLHSPCIVPSGTPCSGSPRPWRAFQGPCAVCLSGRPPAAGAEAVFV